MLQRSKETNVSRAEARRQHLLETAQRLFVEQGFHKTGVAQLAAVSGIAVQQIYRDFESKEAIIAAICELNVSSWLEEGKLAAAVADADQESIRTWISKFVGHTAPLAQCRIMVEIIAEAGRNPRIAELLKPIDHRVRTSLFAALAALTVERAKNEDISHLADLILAMGAGVKMRQVVDRTLAVDPLGEAINDVISREISRFIKQAEA